MHRLFTEQSGVLISNSAIAHKYRIYRMASVVKFVYVFLYDKKKKRCVIHVNKTRKVYHVSKQLTEFLFWQPGCPVALCCSAQVSPGTTTDMFHGCKGFRMQM